MHPTGLVLDGARRVGLVGGHAVQVVVPVKRAESYGSDAVTSQMSRS